MNTKEFVNNIEGYIDQLATTASFTQDKQQVQRLRELLYVEAHSILKKKLTEKCAYRHADRLLAEMRKEQKQRLREATQKTPEQPASLSIEPETQRTNRVLA